ncbi:MAG: hypothetical protein OXT65_06790 [Alphaproteobacteria bacterium]|nr:hypothetical protein [Alphaproteobacteria bacterium]
MSLAARQSAPVNAHGRLNAVLENAGVSKTVYSFVMPETERALDAVMDADREGLRDMYREAWTQKQDAMHEDFMHTWTAWSAPVLQWDAGEFPWSYTTGGASEALREVIYAYGHRARQEGFKPVIHIFEGEYEGFRAYAEAAGIDVIAHNRTAWQDVAGRVGATDQFYISHPSAIDGNVWADFDVFIADMNTRAPTAEVMLDLTYIGAVARDFTVNAKSPNISALFFSLSKPMGVYYHRIGGVFSRRAYPGLFGNKWFKNLLSIRLGTVMMRHYGVYDLPRKYTTVQAEALKSARAETGLDLQPSDVWLLATGAESDSDLARYLVRAGQVRVCLTPRIAQIVDPAADTIVRARPHEVLPEREGT